MWALIDSRWVSYVLFFHPDFRQVIAILRDQILSSYSCIIVKNPNFHDYCIR